MPQHEDDRPSDVLFFAGIALILLGAYLFFMRDENISTGSVFAYFWPTLFVIPVGILLHWLYFGVFGRNAVGVLVPAGIVTTAGIVCQIASAFLLAARRSTP